MVVKRYAVVSFSKQMAFAVVYLEGLVQPEQLPAVAM